jgi:hypothetical protein
MVLVAFILALQGTPQATVFGEVRDADTGQPLVNATVVLTNQNHSVLTNGLGRYALKNVPAGPQHLTFRLIGHAPRTLDALVPQSGSLEINVTLRPYPVQLAPIYVTTPNDGSRSGEYGLWSYIDRAASLADLKTHPLLAEPDGFLSMAGGDIAVDPEAPTGLHIRGGGTDQTAYLLDGIPVFNPYHVAGTFTALNPDALADLELSVSSPIPGSPETISGVVSARTRTPSDRHTLQGSISTSQVRSTLEGPLAGRVRYLLSGRTGFVPGFSATTDVSQVGSEAGDWLGKIELPMLKGQGRVLGYYSSNELSADAAGGLPPVNPAIRRNDFSWTSLSIGGEFSRTIRGATARLIGWSARTDATARWNGTSAILSLDAFRHDAGFLLSASTAGQRSSTHFGLRFDRSRTSYQVRSDSAGLVLPHLAAINPIGSLFGQHGRRLGARMTILLGGTLSRSDESWRVSPRGLLRYQAGTSLALTGSAARLHQFGQSLRNPESVVGLVFPAELYVGTGTSVPVARSDQVTVGAELTPAPGLVIDLQLYTRNLEDILLVAPGEPEPFATRQIAAGTGTSRGASLRVTMATRRYSLIGNYGIQRTRMKLENTSYAPAPAATHTFDGGIAVFPSATWTLRVGASGAAGRRTTIFSGAWEWEACNLLDQGCEFGGSPHYGQDPLGGATLPGYFRIDLSVRKHWHIHLGKREAMVALFGTVTNVFARHNILTYARNPVSGALTEIEMRPLSPLVIGMDWRF